VRLENSFTVPGSPDAAWDLLLDVERVIPCMPGAELTETVDESNWKAKMHVKLGPIALTFATDLKREEVDAAARRAKLFANAREMRGRGAAQARIDTWLETSDSVTTTRVVTDLTMSGPVAQYGRGIVHDVASQLVGQFADCLARELEPAPPPSGEIPSPSPTPAPAPQPSPVGGLQLVAKALGRSLLRLLKRVRER
jgi:uncharacterized protein